MQGSARVLNIAETSNNTVWLKCGGQARAGCMFALRLMSPVTLMYRVRLDGAISSNWCVNPFLGKVLPIPLHVSFASVCPRQFSWPRRFPSLALLLLLSAHMSIRPPIRPKASLWVLVVPQKGTFAPRLPSPLKLAWH